MVFFLQYIQEKFQEQNRGLYVTFINLTKAFGILNRIGHGRILENLGSALEIFAIVVQDQLDQVRHGSNLSQIFLILDRVLSVLWFHVKTSNKRLDQDGVIFISTQMIACLFHSEMSENYCSLMTELLFIQNMHRGVSHPVFPSPLNFCQKKTEVSQHYKTVTTLPLSLLAR